MKEDAIEFEGVVSDVLPSAMFRVDLENGHSLLATMAGIRLKCGQRTAIWRARP